MIIATIKELKNNENRVGLTPYGVKRLVQNNHKVIVQKDSGAGAGFSDNEYISAGAKILDDALSIVKKADLLVKVKEPISSEYVLLDNFKGKTLFTYLHLAASDKNLTKKLLENKITAVAYETVQDKKGELPLLHPMSQVAGVLAVQYGAQYLQERYGGRGVSLGVIDNAPRAEVVVIGGGGVGSSSARTAAGMGANVILLDINDKKIMELKKRFAKFDNLKILKSTKEAVIENVKKADLLIGAVLVAGAKAPVVVTKDMVSSMKKGAVVVDVAIDQGGCIEGSKPTTHDNPIFKIGDKIFCCITNIPGQVALQSTLALTNSTLDYLLNMANKGVVESLREDKGFLKGLNTHDGYITFKPVAEALSMMDKYKDFD